MIPSSATQKGEHPMQSDDSGQLNRHVLVAYSSRYGSTREVAEEIADALSKNGLNADVDLARNVNTLAGYQAVILGAPFYIGRWQKEAQQFLIRNRKELIELPVAIFALGPISSGDQEQAKMQLDEELAKYPWLHPIDTAMFGGKYDPPNLSVIHRLLTLLPASPLNGLPASDFRDWTAIRDWANNIGMNLQPVVSNQATQREVHVATPDVSPH
jgi:menaquinone-dependent protoporphyrinogen oxidase